MREWSISCDSALHNNETLKWLASLSFCLCSIKFCLNLLTSTTTKLNLNLNRNSTQHQLKLTPSQLQLKLNSTQTQHKLNSTSTQVQFALINEYLFFNPYYTCTIVVMSDFDTLMKQASDLGYEGQELREYVAKEQAILRDERKEKREADKERCQADLLAQKEQHEREQREHEQRTIW